MIIHKGHEVFAPVNAPLFRTVLTVQRMSNLKHVHTVEAGVDAFIALVVRTAVEHLIIYN